jgi:hypothetical protein
MKLVQWPKTVGAMALTIALGASVLLAGSPNIVPLSANVHGKAYGEWSGAWWQWVYAQPNSTSPVTDTTGEFGAMGQAGSVWFLAGTYGTAVERTLTVPSGKFLFVPIINTIWINVPELGDNPWSDEQREFAREYIAPFIDNAYNLKCVVDGVEVPNVATYRCATPDGKEYMVTFPTDDNPWAPWLKAGTYGPCVDDGIYLMLPPLTPGQHTIHFTAASVSGTTPFALEVTYNLTVQKGNARVTPPNAMAYGKSLEEWLSTYWSWFYSGADPAQGTVNGVKLMPLPAGEQLGGAWTPEDPAYLKGSIEVVVPSGTPFVLPEFAWVGERYQGYPGVPDDPPMDNAIALQDVAVSLTIDGVTVISDANKADFYIPPSYFDPIVTYPAPSSYGSVAAVFYQGVGFVSQPLPVGTHVIHLYEPMIIKAGDYPGLPAGLGMIYDNTWTIKVVPAGKPAGKAPAAAAVSAE